MAGSKDSMGDGNMVDLEHEYSPLLAKIHELEEYGDRWRRSAEKTGELVVKLEEEAVALRARVARMEAVMRRHEWVWKGKDFECLVCHSIEGVEEHDPGCEWVAAMGEA
jgi:hypothetical protein